MLPEPQLAETMSVKPSPLTSPTAALFGFVPTTWSIENVNPPVPFPKATVRFDAPKLAVTMS